MPLTLVNGLQLFVEERGGLGAPVVLVHGSWGDHHNWDAVVPGLARTFRVVTYDRRGHSQSERVSAQGRVEEDVADLASIVTGRGLAPAHVIGNSFGALIALKLAAAQPELIASLIVHEPPLIDLLEDDERVAGLKARIAAVLATLQAGDAALGARQFVETVALGPGMWEQLPLDMRRTFIFNAPTWVDEVSEPNAFTMDLGRLATFGKPALASQGDQSPPFFGAILDRIGAALPQIRRHTFPGAGHVPHVTHPAAYIDVVTRFIEDAAAVRQ